MKKSKYHRWSEAEIDYLREIAEGKYISEIIKLMSDKFDYEFKKEQIKYAMNYNKIYSFTRGKGEPWNKGVKVGNSHIVNIKDIGSEYTSKKGFVMVKVAQPNRWVAKHRYTYEQHYGKIKGSDVVIFLDGNKKNFDIDNLRCVTRQQAKYLNVRGLVYNDAELTKTGIEVANLIIKTNELKKKVKK